MCSSHDLLGSGVKWRVVVRMPYKEVDVSPTVKRRGKWKDDWEKRLQWDVQEDMLPNLKYARSEDSLVIYCKQKL